MVTAFAACCVKLQTAYNACVVVAAEGRTANSPLMLHDKAEPKQLKHSDAA